MSVLLSPWRACSAVRYSLGEGARNHADGFVAVDLLGGRLLGVQQSRVVVLHDLGVPLGAVAPCRDGGWIAAADTGVVLLPQSGSPRWIARPEDRATTPMRMNDAVADPHGRFWAGSMPFDGRPGLGSLYRVDTDHTVTRVLTGLSIPNGPAFDATGSVMYLADSARGIIWRYGVDVATGALDGGEIFARVTQGSPDGMVVDESGHLWSAVWGASKLVRWTPDGVVVEEIPVPARQPTSVAISTTEPFTALVTTAAVELAPQADDGRLLMAAVAVGGLPTCSFGR